MSLKSPPSSQARDEDYFMQPGRRILWQPRYESDFFENVLIAATFERSLAIEKEQHLTTRFQPKALPLLIGFAFVAVTGSNCAAQSGETVYQMRCAPCHGSTGMGDGPSAVSLQPPPEPFSTGLKGRSDQWIATIITKGGAGVGLPPAMPAQPALKGPQLADLIQYVKGLAH